MDLLNNLSIGAAAAFSPVNLFYCFVGVFLGTFIGVLPGIGALAAVSMLLPLTYYLEPLAAVVMLAGVFYGAEYGGSTASILLNLPGSPSSAVVCLDGYPMSRKGRAGVALFIATMASFVGGSIGIIILMSFAPLLVQVALSFGPTDYFAVMVFGLLAAATISSGSQIRSICMVVAGLALGCVGIDVNTGTPRYTFGTPELYDGINIIALAMGLYGVSEIISSINRSDHDAPKHKITLRSMMPTGHDLKASGLPFLRGSAVGSFFGILPGTGATVASFIAYAVEKRSSREPAKFGTGAVEGIAGPESANNAAAQTGFVPTLAMGIPGSPTMALILGALMLHGISPGPSLMTNEPSLFWGLVVSFWIGNILLVILNVPMIGVWVRLLQIPYNYLYPAVIALICIGVYSINNSAFDIWMVVVFGVVGYGLKLLKFEPAPLLIGFVLGPMIEENFRRALRLSRGDYSTFIDRPISATVLGLSLLLLLWTAFNLVKHRAYNRGSLTS